MAKKTGSKKPEKEPEKEAGAAPRKDDRTPAQLTAELDQLDSLVQDMRSVVQSMLSSKIDTMNVDGVQKFPRAKDLLSEYASNVWHALYRARLKLGKTTRLPVSDKP